MHTNENIWYPSDNTNIKYAMNEGTCYVIVLQHDIENVMLLNISITSGILLLCPSSLQLQVVFWRFQFELSRFSWSYKVLSFQLLLYNAMQPFFQIRSSIFVFNKATLQVQWDQWSRVYYIKIHIETCFIVNY